MRVQVKDGTWYEGVFTSATKGSVVTLRFARKVEGEVVSLETISRFNVSADNLVQVFAKDILFVEDMKSSAFAGNGGWIDN